MLYRVLVRFFAFSEISQKVKHFDPINVFRLTSYKRGLSANFMLKHNIVPPTDKDIKHKGGKPPARKGQTHNWV